MNPLIESANKSMRKLYAFGLVASRGTNVASISNHHQMVSSYASHRKMHDARELCIQKYTNTNKRSSNNSTE